MAEEFVQQDIPPQKDCGEYPTWGSASSSYHYIFKGNKNEAEYPPDACPPWYHSTAQIDSIQVNTDIIGNCTAINVPSATITADTVNATNFSSQSKAFNIPHPTKDGKRLWHGCLEGPEYGVYVRGRLTNESTIKLPDYWDGLVDPETITVHLTQIGCSQDLIIDAIEWGKRIKVKSNNASKIDCYYTVNAMRKDVPVLEVEVDA
jgi:hypothetical protein